MTSVFAWSLLTIHLCSFLSQGFAISLSSMFYYGIEDFRLAVGRSIFPLGHFCTFLYFLDQKSREIFSFHPSKILMTFFPYYLVTVAKGSMKGRPYDFSYCGKR